MPPMAPWVYTPHSGGQKIPPITQEIIRKELADYSCQRPWHPKQQLMARFKSQFCYIDTIDTEKKRSFPLCRLRYFRKNSFSLALFAYSHERYEPTIFSSGKLEGTLIEALELCEPFII